MKSLLLEVCILVLSAVALSAQPRIDTVQNNYSYLLPGNPNYGIAQGSIFIIKGSNLSNSTTSLQNVPLQTTLNGVSARVTVNGTSTNVILYYLTPGQLGGILPSSTPAGTGTITVTNNGQTSPPAQIVVVQSAFGTLTLNGSGTGPAAVYDATYNFLSSANSAKPGDVILLYGTGAGPAAGDESVQQVQVNLANVPIVVEIGGVSAMVLYHGRTIFPGLDQINVVVPSGVEFGCSVSVSVKSGAYASNLTTIPVAANGGTCPAPPAPPTPPTPPPSTGGDTSISQTEINQWLAAGQFRSGSVGLTRETSYSITDNLQGGSPSTTVSRSDTLSASFNRITGADLTKLFNSQIAAPAVGSCTVITGVPTNPFPNLTYTSLDAGASIAVSGPAGSRTAPRSRTSTGVIGYSAQVGSGNPGDYLDAGRYTFTGPGGPDVGSFSGSIDVAQELVWTNRTSLTVVDRNTPLTVMWSGGEPTTLVTIQGTSVTMQGSTISAASFLCLARNTDRQFTVPTSVLTQLPASSKLAAGPVSFTIRGTLAIASVGKGVRMNATGVDYLTAGSQVGVAQSAEYK